MWEWLWARLSVDLDVVGVVALVLAAVAFWRARRNARRVIAAHLDAIAPWAGGPAREGWTEADITLDHQIGWLDPTHTVFPLASGPVLVQMTLGDKLTLGRNLVGSIVELNQTIESFNAVLGKAEAMRAAHAVPLARLHRDAVQRIATARAAFVSIDLDAALGMNAAAGPPNDVQVAARLVIAMFTMLHTGLIGRPGSQGVCAAYRAASTAFDRKRRP